MGFKTINCCGRPSRTYAAGVTQFASTTGLLGTNTVETRAQVLINSTITWANLLASISANTLTAASTIQTRKNAGPGAQSVSISNGATGTFEDATNTDSLAASDLADYQIAAGGATGSMTMNVISSIFIAATGTFYNVANSLASAFAVASSFVPLTTTLADKSATESNSQYTIRASGTFSNLTVNVTANTTTAASTLNFRKNTGNGSQVVSISDGATGRFTDAVNTDAVVSGDVLDYGLSLGGAVSGSISCTTFQTQFQDSTLNGFIAMNGDALGSAVLTAASTYYLPFQGAMDANKTESLSQMKTRSASTFSKFFVRLIANSLTAASTAGFRKNTANGNMSVSISDGATGTFEDQTNTDAASATDVVNYFISPGGTTGTLQPTIFGVYTQAYGKITETDGVRVFDGPVKKIVYNILTSAAVRIADSTTKTVTKVLREILRIRDFVTRAFPRAFTDALRVRDYEKLQTSKAIAEIVRINDLLSKRILSKIFTDAVMVRDIAARTTTKVLRDVVRIADFVRRSFPRTFTDALRIRDYEKLRTSKAITDIIRITDSESFVKSFKRLLTDMVRVVDTFTRTATLHKAFTDAVRIADRTTRTITKILLDIVRIVDRATATLVSGVKQIIVTDVLRITDYARRTVTKPLLDMVRITDAETLVKSIIRKFTDAIAIQDRIARTSTKPLRDMLRIADMVTKTTTKRLFDIVRINDTKNLVKSFIRSFTDALRVVDRVAKTTTKPLRDTVRIRDAFSRVVSFARMFTDPIRIRDRVSKTVTKNLLDIVRIVDAAKLTHILLVAVTDTLRIVDFATKTITKRLTDMLRIRETIVATKSKFLVITDTLRIAERTAKTITKPLIDVVRIAESIIVNRVGHVFSIIVTDVVRVIGVPIGSIVTIIHQGAAAVVEAAKSIGMALENALHPGSKRKGSLGEADS